MFVRNKWMVTLLVALLVVTLITGCGIHLKRRNPEKILTIAAITDPVRRYPAYYRGIPTTL